MKKVVLLISLVISTLIPTESADRVLYLEQITTRKTNQNILIAPTGTGVLSLAKDLIMSGTGQIDIPSGTTAQRSSSPSAGMIRFNTTLSQYEGYNGSAWAALGGGGSSPFTGYQSIGYETLSGFGSTGTAVPYYTNSIANLTKNTGIFTVSNSSITGMTITILQDAVISVSASGFPAAGGTTLGISINAASTSTALEGLSSEQRIAIDYARDSSTINNMSASATFPVESGDVIRPHGNGLSAGAAQWHFHVTAFSL